MASSMKHIELPIPYRGLNTDSSASQAGPEYARELHNVVVPNNQELRVRNGWQRGGGYYTVLSGTKANMYPYSVYAFKEAGNASQKVVVHVAEEAASTWSDAYLSRNSGGGVSAADVVVTFPSAGSGGAAPGGTLLPTAGPHAVYDGDSYAVSISTSGGESRLCVWGGGYQYATHNSGGVTISNGAFSGTFGSAPANSMVGYYMRGGSGATGPLTGYAFHHRITAHSGGSTAFTIAQPYGMGENTTNVPNAVAASCNVSVEAMPDFGHAGGTELLNNPVNPGCVAIFRERLFIGRGRATNSVTDLVNRGNKLQWSYPGQMQKLPTPNFTYVGDNNEVIMALAAINDTLLIFTMRSVYTLTGYDEASFQIRKLYSDLGCVNSHSIAYYGGQVIFVSEKGVFATNGQDAPVELSQQQPGIGIRRDLEIALADTTAAQPYTNVSTLVFNDKLVLAIQSRDITVTTPRPAWMYDFKTGAWSTWGNTSSSGYRQPWMFASLEGKHFAVMPYQVVDITECWSRPPLTGFYKATANADTSADTDWTTSDASTATVIDASVRFQDFRFGGPDTARVRGVQVEHNCHYYNSTSSPRVAWAVTLDVDADIDTTALVVDNIDARYIGNVSTPAYDKYFTDRFTENSFGTEGASFRVRLSKTATVSSAKIFKVYLLVDGQATQLGRVDNATV